ncbi:TransThyretin-Related family domain [Caenorhabditis elegans]|uniref:TransThyretin-Related family domain n=1 Tax=Caenorhabditis elegans TaxID=6239 RepID=A3FPK9_CAEEL|nr:TransThyretin-Related family domain [Caenorhabditis elegans]CAM33502.1 TransThyretin-Related family domain [Caenorhabditis elegans]|eukprot:NP_001123125.1 TransThyretin-Related family domain [Caenorhabditis elegans]
MKFLILCALASYALAETTRVRATIHCGFQKRVGVPIVSLMEEDFSSVPILNLFDSDDVLDETTVEYGEHFTLDGGEIEIFSTEPYLQIVHKCFGTERTDIIDLSEFEADSNDILHVGHIVLTHEGHKITQAV